MEMLNINQVVSLIKAVGGKRTVLVRGEKGIGKSSIYHMLAADPALQGHYFAPIMDTTQMSDGSLWMPAVNAEKGVAYEIPNSVLGISAENQRGVNGAKPVVHCYDEVGKAPQYIHNYLAPIVNDRRLGGYHFPEDSIVFCCTNLAQEGLGDTMKAHFADRMIIVTMRKPTQEEWQANFAIPNALDPVVIAATKLYPQVFDRFLDYEEGGKFHGQSLEKENPYITNPKRMNDKVATPRSLHSASDIMQCRDHMDMDTLRAALEGAVGAFAGPIMTTLTLSDTLPEYAQVVSDPKNCRLPDKATAQIVQVMQLVNKVKDRSEAEAVATYVLRMQAEMQAMFAMTVGQAPGKAPYFVTVPAYQKLALAGRDLL